MYHQHNNFMFKIYKKISLGLCSITLIFAFLLSFIIAPNRAHAQGATVPVSRNIDPTQIKNDVKTFSMDWLATTIAKQILHQITISTINWINTGFKGSPGFLTNPQGFFMDVGDQVTGEFLDSRGALSRLCSPFSIDIRLALALDQTITPSKRYTCTLGTIVNNMEAFTGGDFSQGGWPGFISLTMEPQNNVYGSYLQAHSDLLGLIGEKKNTVQTDINQGHGFLSWQSCKDVTSDFENGKGIGLSLNDEENLRLSSNATIKTGTNDLGMSSSIVQTYDPKTDTTKVQDCQTQTPGSVIAGTLQKSVDSPIVEGELANDINGVVNALVSQMISKMLSGGLAAMSGGGSSGGKVSYTQRVIDDINKQGAAAVRDNNAQLSNLSTPALSALNDYKAIYDQAVSLISGNRDQYVGARACLVAKTNNPQNNGSGNNKAQQYVSNIDTILATQIYPLLSQLTAKQASSSEQIAQLNSVNNQQGSQIDGARSQIPLYDTAIRNNLNAQTLAETSIPDAQKELTTIQTQSQQFSTNAALYNQACMTYPNMIDVPSLNLNTRH